MGEMFRCPLCCGEEFSCRKTLKAHLQSYMGSFVCVICSEGFDSLPGLINHLDGECQDRTKKHTEDLDVKPQLLLELNPLISKDDVEISQERNQQIIPTSLMAFTLPEKSSDNNSGKAVDDEIHSQEDMMTMMHMIDGSHNRYVIMSGDGTSILTGDMLTTQNSDGTISITSLKDENQGIAQLEEENVVSQEQETEVGFEGAELYTCNTCGVTFTSVVEHIQMYHNDQDVVLEMADPSNNIETQSLVPLVKTSTVTTNDEENEKIDPSVSTKRVITDAGNIVETHYAGKTLDKAKNKRNNCKKIKTEQICLDKTGRPYTRKLVQVDKFWKESNRNSPQKEKEQLEKEKNTNTKNTTVQGPAGGPVAEERERRMIVMSMTSLDGSSMKVFQCTRCRVHFLSRDDYERHDCGAPRPTDSKVAVKEMTVLDQQAMYHCPVCSVIYNSSKSLCAHMKVHKNVKTNAVSQENNITKGTPGKATAESAKKPFKCEVCDTIFPTNKSLRLHRRMHDPVKNRPVDPPVQYGEAGQTGDVSPDMFHCEQCDKWIHEGYRDIHTNYHRSTHEHNCDICNRKFPSLDYLIMHMNVHNTDKIVAPNKPDKTLPYKCLFCTRKFARPHEKVKHERIHTGEKPHTCEICGKSFRVSYCLTLHMRTHTGARPYACPYCEKRFKAHSVFNHHLLTHSNVRAYKCPFCPKAFKTSVQLAGHKNSHTKPFSCTQCNRPFASLYAVRVHTETHGKSHNNLKFSCALCGASYARAFALKDHVRQQHPDDALEETPTQYILPTGKEEWPAEGGEVKPGKGAAETTAEPYKPHAPEPDKPGAVESEPMALEVEELAICTEDSSGEVIM